MRKLNGMTMRPNQDPGENLTEVFQQRNELEHIGESFTEACILDIILEGLSDEYEPMRGNLRSRWKKLKSRCKTCTPTASRAVMA